MNGCLSDRLFDIYRCEASVGAAHTLVGVRGHQSGDVIEEVCLVG